MSEENNEEYRPFLPWQEAEEAAEALDGWQVIGDIDRPVLVAPGGGLFVYHEYQEAADIFRHWGIVELMGRVKMAGLISEVEIFGGKMGRIDIPQENGGPPLTRFFGQSGLYLVTPCTEKMARAVAYQHPVNLWDQYQIRVSDHDW